MTSSKVWQLVVQAFGAFLLANALNSSTPILTSWSYDAGYGRLLLMFDQLVSAGTFNPSSVSLSAARSGSQSEAVLFRLSGMYNNASKYGNVTRFSVLLLSDDYALIVLDPMLGKSQQTLYLSMTSGAVLSAFGNSSAPIPPSEALQVTNFTADRLPPFVASFSLNMNNFLLSMTFTEPIVSASFSLDGIAIQGVKNMEIAVNSEKYKYYQFQRHGSSIVALTNLNRTLTLNIGEYNANQIKARLGLATRVENCWLSAWLPFVNDTAANPISYIAFDYLHGIQPETYIPDTTAPTLRSWHFDRGLGNLTLLFSEPVYISFFNFSGILLTNGNGVSLRVINPAWTSTTNTERVLVQLSLDQFHELQALPSFFETAESAFLVLDNKIVVDTSAAQNFYLSNGSFLRVSDFTADHIRPQLVDFQLDLDLETLQLRFSESVAIASVQVPCLRLQSTQEDGRNSESIQISGNDLRLLTTRDDTILLFALQEGLAGRLRTALRLAKSTDFTFVSFQRCLVTDTAGNDVYERTTDRGIQASKVITDRFNTSLLSWQMDMHENTLLLNFSRAVLVSTIRTSAAFLSSSAQIIASTKASSLGNTTVLSYTDVASSVLLRLSSREELFIKSYRDFCSSISNCFLSFTPDFARSVQQVFTNGTYILSAVAAVAFRSASAYQRDKDIPKFVNFSLDMNTRKLELRFSKPIDPDTVRLPCLRLSSANASIAINLTSFSNADTHIDTSVVVDLSPADYVRIQNAAPIAASLADTRLSFCAGFASDIYGNEAKAQLLAIGEELVADSTSPTLLAVLMDAAYQSELTLYFSEAIVTRSFNISNFAFASPAGSSYSMSQARVMTTSAKTTHVLVNISSIRAELTARLMALDQPSTYVYVTQRGAVRDVSVQQNAIAATSLFRAIREGLRPLFFRLDMITGVIEIYMSFHSAVSALTPQLFRLVSSSGEQSVILTTFADWQQSIEGQTLLLTLAAADRDTLIKTIPISGETSLVLQLEEMAIIDANNKRLGDAVTIPCIHLVQDFSQPVVISFALDLAVGLLTLRFSKIVDLQTFDQSVRVDIQSQSTPGNASQVIRLRHLALEGDQPRQSSIVNFDLNFGAPVTDREQILLAFPLARDASSAFLSLDSGLVFSTSDPASPSAPISSTLAQRVAELIKDQVEPQIQSFDLDLSQRFLDIHFTEAVNHSSLHVAWFKLLADPENANGTLYQLTGSSTVQNTAPSRDVRIQLSAIDIDAIMALAPSLLLSPQITYLSVLPNSFYDLANPPNGNEEVFDRYAIPVSIYHPDQSRPLLLSFNLSIEEGTLDLLFSEVIDCESFQADRVLFQSREFVGIEASELSISLSNRSTSYCRLVRFQSSLQVFIDYLDLVAIKSRATLLRTASDSFIRLLDGAVRDAAGNANAPMDDGFALAVTDYSPDLTPPKLLTYSVSTTKLLSLYFSEPIDTEKINIPYLFLRNDRVAPTREYPLLNAKLLSTDSGKMRLTFQLLDDYFRITADSIIFLSQNTTFLRLSRRAFRDKAGNAVEQISSSDPLQLGPSILYWDLDLQSGALLVAFSEPIKSEFTLAGFTLQTGRGATSRTIVRFSASPPPMAVESNVFLCLLAASDWYSIKTAAEVYAIKPQLYLTMAEGLTTSASRFNIIPDLENIAVPAYDARPVRYVTPDTTPPACTSFGLDIGRGAVLLLFSEPVDNRTFAFDQAITIFSRTDGSFLTLSAANTSYYLVNQTIIFIQLNPRDSMNLKLAYVSGKSIDRCILNAGIIQDFAGNAYEGITQDDAVPLSLLVPDLSPPNLVDFKVDLTSYRLTLTFDDVLDSSTFPPTNIILLSNSNLSSSASTVSLTNYSLINQTSANRNEIFVDLGYLRADMFALERDDGLFNSVSDSFIAIRNVTDIFGNTAPSLQIMRASEVALPTSSVVFESFDLYDASATLKQYNVYLSRVANLSSVSCGDYILQERASATGFGSRIIFSSGDCPLSSSGANDRVLRFNFLSSIIVNPSQIGRSESTTYAYVSSAARTRDVYGNSLATRGPAQALRVGPRLLYASLDLTTQELLMIFSAPVDVFSLRNVSKVGFYSSVSASRYYLQSSQSSPSSICVGYGNDQLYNDTVAMLRIDDADMSAVKLLQVTRDRLFILLATDSFRDERGVFVNAINASQPPPVNRLLPDYRKPQITNLSLDLGSEVMTIQFDEPLLKTVVLTKLTLQSVSNLTAAPGGTSYRLTGGTYTVNSTAVIISLSLEDLIAIKLRPALAKNLSSCFLSASFGFVADLSNNYMRSIRADDARAFDAFVPDATAPYMTGFQLDLRGERALLSFFFSEPVAVSTLNLSTVIVQSRFSSRDGSFYRLQGGDILSPNSEVVDIALLDADYFNMRLLPGLIRRRQSSYLTFTAGLVQDLYGNAVVAFRDGAALACTIYLPDTTPPVISFVAVDLSAETLSFSMSEPVLLGSVNVSAVTVTSASAANSVTLLSSTVQQSALYSATVVLQLSALDLNRIKAAHPLASTIAQTQFAIDRGFAIDFVENVNAPISVATPLKAAQFLSDLVRPIVSFYTLDMVQGVINLQMSEAVDSKTILPEQVVIQSTPARRFGAAISLNSSDFIAGVESSSAATTITIRLPKDVLNDVKSRGIGRDTESSFLTWSDEFLADHFNNLIIPAWDAGVLGATPRTPDALVADTRPPVLERWFLDRSKLQLYLLFDEAVKALNLTNTSIVISYDVPTSTRQQYGLPATIFLPVTQRFGGLQYLQYNSIVQLTIQNLTLGNELRAEATLRGLLILTELQVQELIIRETPLGSLQLFVAARALSDLSVSRNFLPAVNHRAEGSPDCSGCPDGQYILRNCTASSDRVCQRCSVCPAAADGFSHHYEMFPCTSYQNTVCAVCTECPYGFYVREPCRRGHDTSCAPCDRCNSTQFAERACVGGLNALCASCFRCSFPTLSSERECGLSAAARRWTRSNCCTNGLGQRVLCSELLAQERAAATEPFPPEQRVFT